MPLDFWAHAGNDEDVAACILAQAKGDAYLGIFNWTDTDKKWNVTGLTADDLKALSKVSGAAVSETASGAVTVSLPARHSTLFEFTGGNFDRLRKVIQIN